MPEISTELLALNAVAELLSDLESTMLKQAMGAVERQRIKELALRKIYGVYCDDHPEDGEHATGEFRLGVILGKNTRIQRTMGCSE